MDTGQQGEEKYFTPYSGLPVILVHQFVQLLRGDGEGYPNAVQSANITLTGILAHESALKGGEIIRLPDWSMSS